MRPGWVRDGAILLGLGLSFAALATEALTVFDTCVGSSTCFVAAGELNVEGFLGLLVLGILMTAGGGTVLVVGLRLPPKAPSALDLLPEPMAPR